MECRLLFGYPTEATEDNWIHDCLSEILESIHSGLKTAKGPPGWPEIVPEQYRTRLTNHRGLRDRLLTYQEALGMLGPGEQDEVLQAVGTQNEIGSLLSRASDCAAITGLPGPIREPAKDLFHFAFMLLTPLGIRDHQYAIIYEASAYCVCPFCGFEYFDAPSAPREALDHYLPESKYPFAAANLRNLVPMGNKCNSRYKLAQDILFSNTGVRRRSFNPYNHAQIQLSLESSEPFAGKNGQLPRWEIDFYPNSEEVDTWAEVFSIRERYSRDVLDPCFKNWLALFGAWCRCSCNQPGSPGELTEAIQRYCSYLEEWGFSDRGFLKAAVFRMLLRYCEQGNQRVITFLLDLAN